MHELKKYSAHQLMQHDFAVTLAKGKRPLWQRALELREINYWLDKYHDLNIAILITGENIAVIDVDNPESSWVQANQELLQTTPMVCQSSRGWHYYFGITEEMNGCKLPDAAGDLKTKGVVIAPPSIHPDTEWIYRWISGITRKELLPMLPPELVITPAIDNKTTTIKSIANVMPNTFAGDFTVTMNSNASANPRGIKNPEAWCLKVISAQGSNGSGQLVRVVTTMRDCGRTAEETLRFLKEVWNNQCALPPWSDVELEYAVRRHFKGT